MAVNVLNAFVAKPMDEGVAFSFAPGEFPMPTDATSALDAGILATDHGAVGPDGFAVSQSRSSTKHNSFGGKLFVTTQDEYGQTVQITFLEDDNVNVVESVFGEANVTVTEATADDGRAMTIYHSADELPIRSWVIQARYDSKRKRFCIEYARVSEIAETRSAHNAPTQYQLTLDVMENANGRFVEEYRSDGKPLTTP